MSFHMDGSDQSQRVSFFELLILLAFDKTVKKRVYLAKDGKITGHKTVKIPNCFSNPEYQKKALVVELRSDIGTIVVHDYDDDWKATNGALVS